MINDQGAINRHNSYNYSCSFTELCWADTALSTLHALFQFIPCNNFTRWVLLEASFYRQGNQGSERLNKLLKVIRRHWESKGSPQDLYFQAGGPQRLLSSLPLLKGGWFCLYLKIEIGGHQGFNHMDETE